MPSARGEDPRARRRVWRPLCAPGGCSASRSPRTPRRVPTASASATSPGLGLWHGRTSANGDIVLGEDQVRAAMTGASSRDGLGRRLDDLLGTRWDAALEEFRFAGDGAPAGWLHQVG